MEEETRNPQDLMAPASEWMGWCSGLGSSQSGAEKHRCHSALVLVS